MMPGGVVVGWDTFPPDSRGCPWLALIGPSLVGKAGSTYTGLWKWWRRGGGRDNVYGYINLWMTVNSLYEGISPVVQALCHLIKEHTVDITHLCMRILFCFW